MIVARSSEIVSRIAVIRKKAPGTATRRVHRARLKPHVYRLRADIDQARAQQPHIGIEQPQIVRLDLTEIDQRYVAGGAARRLGWRRSGFRWWRFRRR